MAVTILESLENAYFNLCVQKIPGISDVIGTEQLYNAKTLLKKGYNSNDYVETLLAEYESVDDVPQNPNI